MTSERQHHVFGPVPSRRLGRSLGVDLVPFKTCSFDCIYCQLGYTTCKTVERKEWVPVDAVMRELEQKLETHPDTITLSGSGEPTLHSRIGEIIERIHAMTSVPVAVLTNGSLLWQEDVREAVARADLVLPSLDAPDPQRFELINRPHPDITFERLLEGLAALRRESSATYWLEVMLLEGYTAEDLQVQQLAERIRSIQPDSVQLNTAVRPPAAECAMAVPPARLAQIAGLFEPPAEVIAEYRGKHASEESEASADAILELIQRRPCTMEDIAHGLEMKPAEVVKSLAVLEERGAILGERRGSGLFYRPAT